ncbi:formin-like protein 3 [Portunus trituberculatus]|uniref:formin-like protein 3 n=1 Tax=Portunus trituberculatus TaxID=210409 RepID=UPI001E1CB015|nr:formin-like protein 3 [Portunus trituberculatus]
MWTESFVAGPASPHSPLTRSLTPLTPCPIPTPPTPCRPSLLPLPPPPPPLTPSPPTPLPRIVSRVTTSVSHAAVLHARPWPRTSLSVSWCEKCPNYPEPDPLRPRAKIITRKRRPRAFHSRPDAPPPEVWPAALRDPLLLAALDSRIPFRRHVPAGPEGTNLIHICRRTSGKKCIRITQPSGYTSSPQPHPQPPNAPQPVPLAHSNSPLTRDQRIQCGDPKMIENTHISIP